MKRSFLIGFSASCLLMLSISAMAFNELALKVYLDGQSASGITAIVDGKSEQTLDNNGMAIFDLNAGAHSVQLLNGEKTLHSFRFDSAQGQLVDASVALAKDGDPRVSIESYFKTETAVQRSAAPTGSIEGTVRSNGFPAIDATVSLSGTTIETSTDELGQYTLEAPRGIYQVVVEHPDLGSQSIDNYRIVTNVTKGSNFSINSFNQEIEEVVVMAKFNASAFQENERYATNVIDTMGIEQIARFGDTDVAAAIIRAPGITVQDDKFIFIRGLGGRYITTTLNGATLPSTNPNRRTVPLDLFPSNIVEQLDVRKTFVPSMPGESTGGNLVINTRSFPDERAGSLSLSMGYVTGLTGNDAYTDPNDGDYDWLGWDDGTKEENITVRTIRDALKFTDYYSDNAAQQLGRTAALLLKDNMNPDEDTALPNLDLGVNFGDIYSITNSDAEIGYFAAANYKNEWTQRHDGTARSYEGGGDVVSDDFSFEENTNTIKANGFLSVGLNIGDNTFKSNTMISRVTDERVRAWDGYDGDALERSIRWTIEYVERQFLSQQFTGQHLLGESDRVTIDWQATASQAKRDAPDRRDVRFDLSGGDDIYNLQVPNLTRRYDDLTDDNYDLSTELEYLLGSTSYLESSIAFGGGWISRSRHSNSRTYGFFGDPTVVDDSAPNLKVSDVINFQSITGDASTGYNFQDKTLPSDSYEADMDLYSFFTEYDMLWQSTYQIIVGARYEDFQQDTETFSLQGEQDRVKSNIEEDTIMPSLGLNWFYMDDQQLRFAVTKTVSRPDFKETSNATFYDPEFDFRVRGNPNLKVADVTNYDIRWEKYFSDNETISIALFYKDMEDPIERVVLPASGTVSNSRTFQNAESAEIYGIEVDGRKDIPINKALTKSFFISLNGSWMESDVELLGSGSRDLQGVPDYTANLILGYDDIINGHELTLLFNQNGDTIVDVGVAGLDDIIEEPRLDVNITYKYMITDDLALKAKVKNLLDSAVKFTQGGKTFRSYEKGVELKVGIDWKF